MFGLILWLFFVALGYFIFYLVVKAAIDNSSVSSLHQEVNTLRYQKNHEIDKLSNQIAELQQILREQNELIKEQIKANRNPREREENNE